MKHAAVGRGIALIAAAAAVLVLGGCSASSSRFDFPTFNLTSSGDTASTVGTPARAEADPATTASLPVPEESVYAGSAAPDARGGVARSSLPPVQSSPLPRAMPASYSPQPGTAPRVQNASYGWQPTPRPQPTVVRVAGEPTAGRTVKVGRGDTLSILAKRYSVSVDAIKSANNLADTRLTAGQELVIPGPGWSVAAPATPAAPSTPVTEASAQGETYKVQKGDTPRGIANKFKISEKELIAANKLTRADRLQINQSLIIPSEKQEAPAPEVAETSTPSEFEAPAAVSPDVRAVKTMTIKAPDAGKPTETTPAPTQSASDDKAKEEKPSAPIAASDEVIGGEPAKTVESKTPESKTPETKTASATPSSSGTSTDQLPQPDPMSGNSFRWPVQGRIISEFGTKPDGGHNDGIDLAVPQGTSVKAAENGVVAYAGDELKPYGNLILIRHSNNWVSAYAHNEELLVKRGDKVRRGQVIAKAGKTGAVSQPLVHFELRKGSRPIDPTKYMANAQASAD